MLRSTPAEGAQEKANGSQQRNDLIWLRTFSMHKVDDIGFLHNKFYQESSVFIYNVRCLTAVTPRGKIGRLYNV